MLNWLYTGTYPIHTWDVSARDPLGGNPYQVPRRIAPKQDQQCSNLLSFQAKIKAIVFSK